ncbi:ENPEP [Cordylochernes scorpioides]|uniref:glutamyl aminopeptidase n=1 Tax=Cordylochernes scorpioides TaxID=51811 RepID=A0ABY6LIP9_9ARAC|nr:ENPEP [Cordylochernes scorpioides]
MLDEPRCQLYRAVVVEGDTAGPKSYLKRYSLKTARGEELWQEMSKRWGHDAAAVMRPWTSREGFPSVTVRVDSFNDSRIFLRQERFVRNFFPPPISSREDLALGWQVPVQFATSGGTTGSVWLRDSREVATEVPLHPGEWAHFNANHTGFFVVHYDLESWDRVTQVLMDSHQSIPAADRAGILHDVFALAAAGRVPYDTALTLSLYLKHERDLAPWQAAQRILGRLSTLLEFSDLNPQFRAYLRKLTEPVYKQLGWDTGDNHQDEMLRGVVVELACSSGNLDCLKEASVRLHTWIQGGEVPSSGMRSLVYRYGMSDTGREEHWAFLWHRYRQASSSLERRSLLDGLAHVREPWIIHRYLKYTMDVTKVNNADFFSALRYIAENPVGRSLVWKFLRDEWPALMRRFSSDSVHLGTLVFAICQHFTSQFELQEMLDFFQRHPGSWARRAVETVRTNILWVRRFETSVGEWLRTEGRRPWWEPALNGAVEPAGYDVLLQPNATLGEFHGRVAIALRVREPAPVVILHASRLAVGRVRLSRAGHAVPLRRSFLYRPRQYLVVEPNVTLPPAEDYRLEVEFRGTLKAPFSSLFLHEFRDSAERRTLVLSRFYPSGARTAFPCFDDPRYLATFDMAVSHDSSLRALSNMPEREEDVRSDGITTTRFQASVPMASSRLGIVVGALPHRETYSTGGTKLRIFAADDKLNMTTFAMDSGLGLLDFYEKFYDIRYPLPKQDMLAIPELSDPVADDNWGLLVFQEEMILMEERDGSLDEGRQVALLLANKVARMWVGHLVSPASWRDTWLTQSFATFIQYKALATLDPGWDENEQFLVDVLGPSMDRDASHFAGPVIPPSASSELKGYLKNYHHRTATTDDFWASMAAVSSEGQKLEQTMATWASLPGLPYISVRRDTGQPLTFLAQQRRLLLPDGFDPSTGPSQVPAPLWTIPLSYRTSEDDQIKLVWIDGEEPFPFHVGLQQPASAWVQFNAGRTAPIVVGYEDEDWAALARALQAGEIRRASDRAGLVADAFLLARAGLATYPTALDLAGFLRAERDLAPWAAAVRALVPLARLLRESTEGHDLITKYIQDLSKAAIANLTWEDAGTHQERQLRALLLELACSHGDSECRDEASRQFRSWVSGDHVPAPQLRAVVYRHGLSANPSAWDHVWNRFLQAGAAERRRLLRGLTYAQDRDLLTRLVEAISDSKLVRPANFFQALGWMADNPAGRPVAWRFVTERWRTLRARFYTSQDQLHNMIKLIASYFDTEEHLQEVVRFFNTEQCGPELRREVLGLVSYNIRWLSTHKADVIDWLRGRGALPES